MNRIARLCVVLLLAAACTESAEPVPVNAIAGTWGILRAPTDPPGSGETLTLTILHDLPPGTGPNDVQVTGQGNWHGEAGPSGTLVASGWVRSDSVSLDITYFLDAQFGGGISRVVHFAGRLASTEKMTGTATLEGGTPAAVTYQKFGPD